MKYIKSLLMFLPLILFAITPLLYYTHDYYKKYNYTCESSTTLTKGNHQYMNTTTYHFSNGRGYINTQGNFSIDGKPVATVVKNLQFNYTISGDNIVMVSTDKYDDLANVLLMRGFIPDFYLYSDRGLSLHMNRINNDAYLFTLNKTPLFYCLIDNT
ncbi:hypothetical protein [Buttiauxella agrestis]|uniref:Uncharacterized protein n=1 Tax=Buttiauxella agrestis ATCC 33320 TaxID=1006004 RepID=A0A085FYX8_9ENTR|nr:hypothetical protein [Buttiauxella agrestis]KFC76673.1 hypothetical protein GBAG_4393 [Buttiauxella agrestis ATCC 33320]